MRNARSIVNTFSLSRIGFALLFVIFFQKEARFFYVSVVLCVFAAATDVLDGYLARRWQVASIRGRLWDSLGDKSFYAAIILTYNAQGFLGPLVSWLLVVREVALYITRVLFVENLPKVEEIRPWTNWHGYFMYLTIVLGLARMYSDIHSLAFPIHPYMQASAYAAAAFGVIS